MATVLPSDPETLQQAIEFFADPDACHAYMVRQRWPNGVTCPTCGSDKVGFIATRRVFECKAKPAHPKRQFTVKVGTIFEDSPIPLKSWLLATWMLVNCKNGVSSYEISRAIGVTQKATWHMLHRIRLAMQAAGGGKLDGSVEVDETFIGGKARNMHADRKAKTIAGRRGGSSGKAAVMGLLQRHPGKGKSRVRLEVVSNTRRHQLQSRVEKHVEDGSKVFTDALPSYNHLGIYFEHGVIDHAERYVDGEVHTNGMENFWSLLKRTIKGTYVSVEPFHLFRYLDEQARRFNERDLTDGERFRATLQAVTGKRLTWNEVTGKAAEA
jgi:hypothetical protein